MRITYVLCRLKLMSYSLLIKVFVDFTEINECGSSPCLHGKCEDKINGYQCHCLAGYTGSHCETGDHDIDIQHLEIDAVFYLLRMCRVLMLSISANIRNPNLCKHGKGIDRINAYLCQFSVGYVVLLCETG